MPHRMNAFSDSAWSGADQADGLRRLFAGSRRRVVPVASNPYVRASGLLIERLTAAFAACGRSTLVVDASETAPEPSELAQIDLASCIETVDADTAYLAARGLPVRFVDTRGSTASFLDALTDAAPQHEIVLLHASASDLARMLGRRNVRPILLAEDRLDTVTHAYGCLKLLAQRSDIAVFDLLVAAPADARLAGRIVERIASCADQFIGALVHEFALIDPSVAAEARPSAPLLKLAASQLALDETPAFTASRAPALPQQAFAAQPW